VNSSKDQVKFINDVHARLNLANSPGSLELCIAELDKILTNVSAQSQFPLEASQQAISHIMGLFNITTIAQVTPKMNEIFVFSAEVKDGIFARTLQVIVGLSKLCFALDIEGPVQPGRVLIHAAEFASKFKQQDGKVVPAVLVSDDASSKA
jgi:hypothetical protein